MPIRYRHIFEELPSGLKSDVNPYVDAMHHNRGMACQPLLFGSDLRGCPGRWRTLFAERAGEAQSDKKVILEIGMHKGQTLTELASHNPASLFLGIDITFKRVVSTSDRIKSAQLKNAISLYGDANYIGDLFEKGELDGAIMFFPDPWNKKKNQEHHRLMNHKFLVQVKHALKPGGFFWFKTDDKNYFDETEALFLNSGFTESSFADTDLALSPYVSNFEKRFQDKGVSTFSAIWMQSLPRKTST